MTPPPDSPVGSSKKIGLRCAGVTGPSSGPCPNRTRHGKAVFAPVVSAAILVPGMQSDRRKRDFNSAEGENILVIGRRRTSLQRFSTRSSSARDDGSEARYQSRETDDKGNLTTASAPRPSRDAGPSTAGPAEASPAKTLSLRRLCPDVEQPVIPTARRSAASDNSRNAIAPLIASGTRYR